MSDFISFCRSHGILINSLPPPGVWRRYRTEDHPRKKNGAVKFLGSVGFCQNHAVDTAVSVWRGQGEVQRIFPEDRTKEKQREAAKKAQWILSQSVLDVHPYLASKGFPEERGNVWGGKLVVPMRSGRDIVGCQLIDPDGNKRFLAGQQVSYAYFAFDNAGVNIFCEGFATGMSIRTVMRALKRRYTICVCFSAGNLEKLARSLGGVVVADNDRSGTGEAAAKRTGLRYFMPPEVGEDFNDFHRRVGVLKAGMALTASLGV